jgi:prepilin-type N-terminal cleavage/methylation domain-containing protein
MLAKYPVRAGFTLLEMILALAIGLVLMISLYNVLNMQVYQSQAGRVIQQEGTLARNIFARMTENILANIGPVPVPPPSASSTTSSAPSGTATTAPAAGSAATAPSSSTEASSTTMATSDTSGTITLNNGVYGTSNMLILTVSKVPSRADPTGQATDCDLRRVSYWLDSGGLAYQELMQPTSSDLNSLPPDVPQGSYAILAPEVKDIRFEYFDGAGWQDSWDGTTLGGPTGEIPIGPPSAIRITLTFSRKGADNTELPEQAPYQHVVAIPAGNNFPQTNQ